MKSPVFGLRRNKKHSKTTSSRPGGGNVNMHGKKTKRMSCMCCECIDLRDKMRDDEHRKEMQQGLEDWT